jgi:hypothetical protein
MKGVSERKKVKSIKRRQRLRCLVGSIQYPISFGYSDYSVSRVAKPVCYRVFGPNSEQGRRVNALSQ